MRAVIFVNGRLEDTTGIQQLLQPSDYLIGADGGTLHCLAIQRQPHVIVGDLDSLAPEIVETLASKGTQIERHPCAKNQTDLELAIERAVRDGADEIVLVGATGGRLDQTMANLLLLAQRDWGVALKIVDGNQVAQILRDDHRLEFLDQVGTTVSILPLTPQVTGISYQGMAYPLQDATLHLGSTRGISNQIVASPATVEIKSGLLLVVTESIT